MALSMDEQRILEEMERKLADDDPLLASRLTSFGRPGIAVLMRARRVRIMLTFLALVVIAAASLAVYALAPFRAGLDRGTPARATSHATRPVTPSDPRAGTAGLP
jgi:DUF3040 family protein